MPLKIDPAEQHTGLNALFTAAVVSRSFREKLLRSPEQALQQGYLGKGFGLSQADAALIASHSATTLPELARQVVKTLGQ
jgi:hypothetical protein